MEAAQELYSMAEEEDMAADGQASGGAAPESTALEASTTGQDNREAAAAQQEALKDEDAEAEEKQPPDAPSEPREEGRMPESEKLSEEEAVNNYEVEDGDGFQSTSSLPVEELMVTMDTVDITWEAARADADYGRYVDVQVPEGYSYASGIRWAEGLRIIWSEGMEEISISCRRADESVSDWLVDIDNPEEYDLGLYTIPWADSVPGDLIQKVNNATFRPDQITQEIVAARSYQVQDQGDVGGWRTHIAILYSDNVLVEIRGKGPSPENIYELINLEN